MNTPRSVFLVLLLGLLAACGSDPGEPPTTPAPSQPAAPSQSAGAESRTLWVSGTPLLTVGEGFMSQHLLADAPDGPWSFDRTATVEAGEIELAPGSVFQVRAHTESRDEADGPDEVLVLDELLTVQSGGAAVPLRPGHGASGITLADLQSLEDSLDLGAIRLDPAPDPAIRVSLDAAGGVQVGDRLITSGTRLEAIAEGFTDCERVANRGATMFRCEGITLVQAGPVEGANIELVVTPGEAAPAGSSTTLRDVASASTAAPATSCHANTACGPCLETPGCHWTGGTCQRRCLMDVACYGPTNPGTTCPGTD